MPSDREQACRVLGVAPDADAATVTRAFRALALKYHPDRNPGDAEAHARFVEITQAYATWSAGEVRAQPFGPEGFDMETVADLFKDLFAQGATQPASEVRQQLRLSAIDASIGCRRVVSFTRQKGTRESAESLTVTVPAGVASGQVLRIPGKGHERPGAGSGDLYLAIEVDPPTGLVRRGDHATLEVVVGAGQVLFGGTIDVEAPDGRATVKVPVAVRDGETVSIPGRGYPGAGADPYRGEGARGDQIVTLRVPLALQSLRVKVGVGVVAIAAITTLLFALI